MSTRGIYGFRVNETRKRGQNDEIVQAELRRHYPDLKYDRNQKDFILVGAIGLLRLLRVCRAERPFLKTLRQTCLLAGSNPVAPSDTKKPFSLPRRALLFWSAYGDGITNRF